MFRLNKNYILLFAAGLIFLTVFIQCDSLMNGLESSKRLYFYFCGSILAIIAASIILLKHKTVTGDLNLVDLSMIGFSIYQFIRLFFTPQTSIINNELLSYILLLIFYAAIKSLALKEGNLKILNLLFLGTGLAQGLLALMQLYGVLPSNSQYFKLTGSFGNPDAFAGYAAPILVYSFGLFRLQNNDNLLKKAGITVMAVLLLSLSAAQIRGAWFAAAAGCIFIYISYKKEFLKSILLRKITLYTSVISLFVISAAIVVLLYNMRPDSANGRLLIWKISSHMFSEHPVFGIGYNRFAVEYNNAQAQYFSIHTDNKYETRIAGNVNRAHNEYIETMVEFGIIGLILFGFVIISMFKSGQYKSENRIIVVIVKASLTTILVFCLTSFPLHVLPSQITFFFLLGILSSQVKAPVYYCIKNGSALKIISAALILISSAIIILTVKQFHNYDRWDKAMTAAFYGNYPDAERMFKALEPELQDHGEFLFNYGGMLSLYGKHIEAIAKLNTAKNNFTNPNLYVSLGNSYAALGDYREAEKSYKYAMCMVPHKLYHKYLLAKLFYKTGEYSKCLSVANQILSTEDKVSSQAADEIKSEMKKLITELNRP